MVVPFHSNATGIEQCCTALLAQDYPEAAYELLFVDDGSRDGSRAIVEAHPRIRVLRQQAAGAYAARNLGLEHATGEIVAFTDADCVVASDWLTRIATAMADSGIDVLLGGYAAATEHFPVSGLIAYENAKNRLIFSGRDASLYYGYTNNMAVRRSVFERLGPFARRMRGSDTLLVRRHVDEVGVESVRYVAEMQVEHLEVRTVRDYLRKARVHSASVHGRRSAPLVRSLSDRQRLSVFRSAVRAEGFTPWQTVRLFLILCAGLVWWQAGKLSPSPERSRPPDRSDDRLRQAA